MHIGNYFGALSQWTQLQSTSKSIYMIADYHSITSEKKPDNVFNTLAYMLASGINPKHSVIFQQSHNSDHTELQWILSCLTPLSWLNRMTQFKTKKLDNTASAGLYLYPTLMASDIILYKCFYNIELLKCLQGMTKFSILN